MSRETLTFVTDAWNALEIPAAILTIVAFLALTYRMVFRHGEKPGPLTRSIYDTFLDVLTYGTLIAMVLWVLWSNAPE